MTLRFSYKVTRLACVALSQAVDLDFRHFFSCTTLHTQSTHLKLSHWVGTILLGSFIASSRRMDRQKDGQTDGEGSIFIEIKACSDSVRLYIYATVCVSVRPSICPCVYFSYDKILTYGGVIAL